MKVMDNIEKINEIIKQGKLLEALELMNEEKKFESFYNDFMLCKSRLKSSLRQFNLGIITKEDYEVLVTKITSYIISILNDDTENTEVINNLGDKPLQVGDKNIIINGDVKGKNINF